MDLMRAVAESGSSPLALMSAVECRSEGSRGGGVMGAPAMAASWRSAPGIAVVREAAVLLTDTLRRLGVPVYTGLVEFGVEFSDAWSRQRPGLASLERKRARRAAHAVVDASDADHDASHAVSAEPVVPLEVLVAALADELLKGRRDGVLEKALVESAAGRVARPLWDLFVPLDVCFREIAAMGA
jgi:hypothetical protein